MLRPVILSGGVGSRLWPLSRADYPKQLLPLINPRYSMLQETVTRLAGMEHSYPVTVVCNEAHRFIIADQLWQIDAGDSDIILEPAPRNTAPAAAVAALHAASAGAANDILLVMPADHTISDIRGFHDAVTIAVEQASQDKLVTFGIIPRYAATGYGYIHAGEPINDRVLQAESFKEKPAQEIADQYFEHGGYYWNSGIFVFQAGLYLQELERHRPDIFGACRRAYASHVEDLDFIRLDRPAFLASPADSIDYAVMERSSGMRMIPVDIGWSDVGSWSELWNVADKDASGNSCFGDVLARDTSNSYVYARDRLVVTVGAKDLVVVQTDDVVMVAAKDAVQDVKDIVVTLKQRGRNEAEQHRKVHRPWGWYDSLDYGDQFQVKRIQVKPGASLSVQMHHHRHEHWTVVSGTAEVLKGEQRLSLSANESIVIPVGVKHSLHNPSTDRPLEIIEVQYGDYLGEDDIVRFADNYGRSTSPADK